jgi:chromosomal replication initiation ATPase DnaA
MTYLEDRTQDAINLLAEIAREFNVDVPTIRDKGKGSRTPLYVAIRRIFCEKGRALKLSTIELGIALNRDHTTITYHANAGTRESKNFRRPAWISRKERRARKQQEIGYEA